MTASDRVDLEKVIQNTLHSLSVSPEQWAAALGKDVNALPAPSSITTDDLTPAQLAATIDHTLLKPESTDQAITRLCEEALEHKFASVCVNSCHVSQCAEVVRGSGIVVCSVVGFPLGAGASAAKAAETAEAVANGAGEIDMVLNVGKLKSGSSDYAFADIKSVVAAAAGRPVKVILETCLLTAEEIVAACVISVLAGATFVKTSTGFNSGGATVEDVALMRRVVGPHHGVKASGGVRDFATAQQMIRAGANRIGTSSGIAIISGSGGAGNY